MTTLPAHTSLLHLGLGLLLCASMACGEDAPTEDTNNEPEEIVQPLECADDEMDCDGTCTRIDEKNCGGCGVSCGRGGLCDTDAGQCGCLNGGTWCGVGQCLITLSDARNCGACGNVCPAAHYCVDGGCVENGEIADVVRLTNEARAVPRVCGDESFGAAPPLTVNNLLNLSAQAHAEDMSARDFFEHDAPPPNASTPTQRMRAQGYEGRATGENIAQGYPTPERAVQGWLNSPGHCKGIMNPGFSEIGVGFTKRGNYWVQNFGRP